MKEKKFKRVGKCSHCGHRRQLHESTGYCRDCQMRCDDEYIAMHGTFEPYCPCKHLEVSHEA